MAAAADPVHGLQLAPDNSQILIQRPAPHAPVRSINAHQLARLVHQYNTADVEDSVLFPFLHGLEGNNIAQNSFFNYARRSDGRVKLPRYRGLVLVRVDEQGLELDIRGNVRKSTTDPKDIHHHDDDDDSDDSEAYTDDEDHVMATLDTTLHMHPVAERTQRRPDQLDTRNVGAPVPPSDASSSMTSASSDAPSNYFASPTNSSVSLSQTSPPTTPNSTTDSTKLSFSSYLPATNTGEPPQQDPEARDRTPVPPPHDVPRRPSHVLTCSFHPDELLTQTPNGAAFVTPRIPDGISLTRNAMALAERFKQAIEAKAHERGLIVPPADGTQDATMSPDGLVYNVYVVTDPFEVFEKELPHLVGIDSKGNLVRKIEFMEREKEEMRNLTRASEIADAVFLGNTGDVPLLANLPAPLVAPQSHPGNPATLPVYPGLDPFDGSNNPGAYDICIECHDMASFPSYAQLRGVEDRLRALEEAWRQRVRETAYNLDREREQQELAMRRQREETRRREELRKRREAEMDMDMDLDEDEDEDGGLTSSSSPSPPHSSSSASEQQHQQQQQQRQKDVKVLDGGMGLGLDMRPLSPPVEPGTLSPRTSEMMNTLAVSSPQMVGQDSFPGSGESLPSLFPKSEAAPIPVPISQPRQHHPPPHHHNHHTRSRSLGNSLSSYSSYGQSSPTSPSPRMTSTKARGVSSIPPRPAPNASQVIHLAFPSSPPATPGTLTSLIPFLHFLHSLTKPRPPTPDYASVEVGSGGRNGSSSSLVGRARSPSLNNGGASAAGGSARSSVGHSRSGSLTSNISPRMRSQTMGGFGGIIGAPTGRRGSQGSASGASSSMMNLGANLPLSRPLRILLHAGDGYTETSVLALSYIMLTGNKTLPEAYLELQVTRSRSFFVYGADVGVLRRVEQRLKLERDREREKIAASIAATAASVGANNGSGSSTPRANGAPSGKDVSTRGAGASSPPSSSAKWRWAGLPSSWRSGSLSSAGVSLLSGAGMFSSVGSSSSNNAPQSGASIANEEDRRAMFTPPSSTEEAENKVMTERPTDMGAPSRNGLPTTASVPNLTRLVGSTAGANNNLAHQPPLSACALPSELVAESPSAVLDQSHHQRVVPSQRSTSLSQSYAPGQQVTGVRRARASTSPMLPSFLDHETWFNDPKFDGSFPSRVLPFLYLGNLAHAGNAYMLHALGITHVVSVGECALIPPANDGYTTYGHNQSGSYQVTTGSTGTNGYMPGRPRSGSLWVEEKEGRIKVLDIKGVCDDGIDSLRPQIHPTVEWIDKARAEGGKILIHCRVGVSRSATVTIAYVMHHLNVSLVDAYLMVRSRRLSVLIQPNMRLLYNLCGWEIELARRRAAEEGREPTMNEGRQLSWPFLAREVHILNERYLS
ncbi:tyrosine/serine/threonine protein phosphatase pps1 [Tulasnella sp. 424]|nr:tyrosine/serine/threonine protein phosphatase pps1 [Tulasnella sp. 424]